MSTIAVSTFYHFAPLSEPNALRTPLLARMKELGIKGTITIAPEGINATISGAKEAVEGMVEHLRAMPQFKTLNHRISYFTNPPFGRSKVKVKRELISLGAEANPSVCVGKYIAPKDWNAIITAPDVVTIDTRNDYEFDIGHFKGAINPATKNFKEMVKFTKEHLDPKKNKRVAMYCTGGIRCEKYSAYLLTQGFEEVYHLEGGILAYLEQMPKTESLWEGHCYVFDERVAVGHGLTKSEGVVMCMGCGRALFKDQTCPKC
ncbi:MAG: rhodanese-related sulfurtransferase [Alphaproteobacteria bacterium]|nr:rhodanese-related sulfurtransferase [Alphaproteobacteria bacterium]